MIGSTWFSAPTTYGYDSPCMCDEDIESRWHGSFTYDASGFFNGTNNGTTNGYEGGYAEIRLPKMITFTRYEIRAHNRVDHIGNRHARENCNFWIEMMVQHGHYLSAGIGSW